MPLLPSLPADATLLHVLRAFPDTAQPLLDYHQVLLRGPSPLTIKEREVIAAFVSGLNACRYCHGVHAATAAAFGMAPEVMEALMTDLDTAPVAPRLKPLLRYVRKLTRLPAERPVAADAKAVFAEGWDERALHDAVSVCALFCFMNRLVEGTGLQGSPEQAAAGAARLSAAEGYTGLRKHL